MGEHTDHSPHLAAVAVETRALRYGAIAGGITALGALLLFWGQHWPLWGGYSVGLVTLCTGTAAALGASSDAFWQSRRAPGGETRDQVPTWQAVLATAAIAIAHAVLVAVVIAAGFALLQRAFLGLEVDLLTAVMTSALVTGLVAYASGLDAARIDSGRLAGLLTWFVIVGIFAAMLTAEDPQWWALNFSALGMGGLNGAAFNLTLIVSGILVVTLADYLARDLAAWRAGTGQASRSADLVRAAFLGLGIAFVGVGLVAVDLSLIIHNSFAALLAVVFAVLTVSAPWTLRGFPRSFFVANWVLLGALLATVILFFPVGYLNLTGLELIAAGIIFAWLILFVRTLAAVTEDARATARATP